MQKNEESPLKTKNKIKLSSVSGLKCCLPHCRKSKRTEPNLKIFRFPYLDTNLLKIWLEKCGLDQHVGEESKPLYLCGKHFAPNLIGKKYLRRGTVPTLNLADKNRSEVEEETNSCTTTTMKLSSSGTLSNEPMDATMKEVTVPTLNLTDKERSEVEEKTSSFTTMTVELSSYGTMSNEPMDATIKEVTVPTLNLTDKEQSEIEENTNSSTAMTVELSSMRTLSNELMDVTVKQTAVPNLNLTDKNESSFQVKKNSSTKITAESSYKVQCFLPHCGKSRRTDPAIKIFRFPYHDQNLLQIWLDKCCLDQQLVKDSNPLYICERHFAADLIAKNYLKRTAMPALNLIDDGSREICGNCREMKKNENFYRDKYLKTLSKLDDMRRDNYKKASKIKRLESKVKYIESIEAQIDKLNITTNDKILCKMLIKQKRGNNTRWNDNEMNLAHSIYGKSVSVYRFLRNKLNLNLPSFSCLCRRVRQDNDATQFMADESDNEELNAKLQSLGSQNCAANLQTDDETGNNNESTNKDAEFNSELILKDEMKEESPSEDDEFLWA